MKKWSLALSCLLLASSLTACGYNRTAAPQTGTRTQGYTVPGTAGTTGVSGYGTTAPRTYGTTAPYMYGANPNTYGTYPNTYGTTTHPYGTTGTHQYGAFNHQLADRAAKAADAVPGVSGSVAVVSGNDALVGINERVAATQTRQRHVIEQQVYSAVKAVLPNHHVRITSDAAMISRIRALDHGIRNQYGYPAGGTHPFTSGPTSVTQNVRNLGSDFANLVRDMGRTVTAPFR